MPVTRLKQCKVLANELWPVVRVGPNELSFATEDALKAIHNPPPGQPMFTKKGTIESLLASLIWSAPNLLSTHDKATHKRLRNALQPAFTAKALLEQEGISQYHIDKEVEKMLSVGSKDPKSVLNLSEEVAGMIWDIVGDLSFGEPLQRHQRDKYEHLKITYATGAPFLELCQFLTEIPIIGRLATLPIILTPFIYRKPRHFLLINKLKQWIDDHDGGRKDFLTAIMSARETANLTHEEMLSNAALFVMVGCDTTAATISALFYLLLKHPSSMARLTAELRTAFPRKGDVTATATLKLPYLGAVIQETLRLLPPINGRGSHRISPGALVDGIYVPAGVMVSADPWSIGRSPRYWAEPHAFRPERWVPGEQDEGPWRTDVRSAWRPFMVGPRVCIGREMALQSIRLMVSKTLVEMDLEMVNKDFVWERDAANDYVWYNFDILVKCKPRVRG
uniref:Cytochrome P450 3A19 n=1 Tax=Pyricularia oryzae (strain P131) TaxID=1143193 RepID=L7IPR2_PYRO1